MKTIGVYQQPVKVAAEPTLGYMRRYLAAVQVRRCLLRYAAASSDGGALRAATNFNQSARSPCASETCLPHRIGANSVGDHQRHYRRLSPWLGTGLHCRPMPVVPSAQSRPASSTATASHDFYAEDSVSFASLGIVRDLEAALERAGLARPTQIQAAGIPAILRQENTVIAAETGSGKTLTYLIPIYNMLLASRCEHPVPEGQPAPDFALVLCPNATLCDQVARVANAIVCEGNKPLLSAMVLSGKVTPPRHPPDIAVATPAGLLTCLMDSPHGARARKEFIQNVRFVVVDEADMLLTGGFEAATLKVLDTLRRYQRQVRQDYEADRRAKAQEESEALGPVEREAAEQEEKETWNQEEREAGQELGREGSRVAGRGQDGGGVKGGRDGTGIKGRLGGREYGGVDARAWRGAGDELGEDGEEEEEDGEDGAGGGQGRKGEGVPSPEEYAAALVAFLRRQGMGGVPTKQYVYVAATLPESGKKSVGQWLKKRHPGASWVAGSLLHRRSPNLSMEWRQVAAHERRRVLLDAVLRHWAGSAVEGVSRTMVFANSTEAAQYIASDLIEDLQGGASAAAAIPGRPMSASSSSPQAPSTMGRPPAVSALSAQVPSASAPPSTPASSSPSPSPLVPSSLSPLTNSASSQAPSNPARPPSDPSMSGAMSPSAGSSPSSSSPAGAQGPSVASVLQFHSGVPARLRDESLRRFQAEGGVFVCTDSAARGLDVPGIGHVVQAEFAPSAIDFLHRVGRTARAGSRGRVTSLFAAEDVELASRVREAAENGYPVDGVFSRKRSFRRKIKKYGSSFSGIRETGNTAGLPDLPARQPK